MVENGCKLAPLLWFDALTEPIDNPGKTRIPPGKRQIANQNTGYSCVIIAKKCKIISRLNAFFCHTW